MQIFVTLVTFQSAWAFLTFTVIFGNFACKLQCFQMRIANAMAFCSQKSNAFKGVQIILAKRMFAIKAL